MMATDSSLVVVREGQVWAYKKNTKYTVIHLDAHLRAWILMEGSISGMETTINLNQDGTVFYPDVWDMLEDVTI
jgi:hypothetical protein